jgi:hypothetical protein
VVTDTHWLDTRADLVAESELFDWGRNSAGARQLSFAVLMDFTEDEAFAKRHYNAFVLTALIDLPAKWVLTGRDIAEFLSAILAQGTMFSD